ncbi:hypothetical protein [Streptomyces sp. 8N706]|uniref:hypothetical protein n=1 Tax=Streptomyces sp. 8N706 TaxID=3457416 RepID=UPI003FD2FA76
MNDVCPECRRYEILREQARRTGDFSRATDYEVLRRRHPTHTVYVPQQPRGRG